MNERTRQRMLSVCPLLLCFACIAVISLWWTGVYQQTVYHHISAFCETVTEENPQMEQQVLSALKKFHMDPEYQESQRDFLGQYGYRADEFGERVPANILIFSFASFAGISCAFLLSVRSIRKSARERIAELTEYLEKINAGKGGTLIQTREDSFSHLQDEIYKTVTMLYQTRDKAIDARKRFAENLENIAHQLKTPITAAFLSLQLMKKDAHQQQMEHQLKRLNRLEEALLTLSKIDAGTLPLTCEKVDVYTALNLAAENLENLLAKKGVSVSIPNRGGMEFTGDLEWTMEAFMNLLKNCAEHTKPNGRVYCDYSQNPLYTEILIWDEGEGFAPEDLPHLFERFYRGTRASGNGLGIGLALARSVFEMQNGMISARNLQGGGACFEIRLYRH